MEGVVGGMGGGGRGGGKDERLAADGFGKGGGTPCVRGVSVGGLGAKGTRERDLEEKGSISPRSNPSTGISPGPSSVFFRLSLGVVVRLSAVSFGARVSLPSLPEGVRTGPGTDSSGFALRISPFFFRESLGLELFSVLES